MFSSFSVDSVPHAKFSISAFVFIFRLSLLLVAYSKNKIRKKNAREMRKKTRCKEKTSASRLEREKKHRTVIMQRNTHTHQIHVCNNISWDGRVTKCRIIQIKTSSITIVTLQMSTRARELELKHKSQTHKCARQQCCSILYSRYARISHWQCFLL